MMRSIASILFLGIFAFNIFGYRIYFNAAENKSTAMADVAIEQNNFNTQDLVSYKFSAKQLPYYTNSKNYEATNGEVEVAGTVMTYVKKRIYNDSIEYVCLPNTQKTKIRNARDEFFKLVNDLNSLSKNNTSKKQNPSNIKPFSFEAIAFKVEDNKPICLGNYVENRFAISTNNTLPNPYLQSVSPPPDFV